MHPLARLHPYRRWQPSAPMTRSPKGCAARVLKPSAMSLRAGVTAYRAGDWQQGGAPISPNAIFGSWKAAVRTVDNTKTPGVVTITPDADPANE